MKPKFVLVGPIHLPVQEIADVLDFLWEGELADYSKWPISDHRFEALTSIANWLTGTYRTPDDYLKEHRFCPPPSWLSEIGDPQDAPVAPVDPCEKTGSAPKVWTREHGKRCRLPGHAATVTVIVGWDHPLQTFFAQVWDTPPGADHYEDGDLLLWLGTSWEQVNTVDELADALSGHVTLPADLREVLGVYAWCGPLSDD